MNSCNNIRREAEMTDCGRCWCSSSYIVAVRNKSVYSAAESDVRSMGHLEVVL